MPGYRYVSEYKYQEYPKWVNGHVVQDAAEERAVREVMEEMEQEDAPKKRGRPRLNP